MKEWHSINQLTKETHRTNTIDLFKYHQVMTPCQYHLKLTNGIHKLMDQNKERIYHDTFPNFTEANFFVPTRTRDTNQEIDITQAANQRENMNNFMNNQRATNHGRATFLQETEQLVNFVTRNEFFWVIKIACDRYPWDKMRKRAHEVDREMCNNISVTDFFKTIESSYENEIRNKAAANGGKAHTIEATTDEEFNKVSNNNNNNKGGKQDSNNQDKGKGKGGNNSKSTMGKGFTM